MRNTTSVTDEDWDYDLAVNLNGPFYLIRAALPHLLEVGGNIVNVASIAGIEGEVYSAAYCAAKHGLVGMTRALAIEYTKEQLRVNVICPGGMLTPQVTEFKTPDDADWNLIMRIAAPRGMMAPVDVAKVIAFLASDDADDHPRRGLQRRQRQDRGLARRASKCRRMPASISLCASTAWRTVTASSGHGAVNRIRSVSRVPAGIGSKETTESSRTAGNWRAWVSTGPAEGTSSRGGVGDRQGQRRPAGCGRGTR